MPLHPLGGLCPKSTARAHRNFTVPPFARCMLLNPPQTAASRGLQRKNKISRCETVE